MKLITLSIITLAAIVLGACAHRDTTPASSYSSSKTSTHGYSK